MDVDREKQLWHLRLFSFGIGRRKAGGGAKFHSRVLYIDKNRK